MFQVVLNGLGSGSSLQRLLDSGMNPAVLRPWREIDKRTGQPTGRNWITVNRMNADGTPMLNKEGKQLRQNIITNAPATLRLQDWMRIDYDVRMAAKPVLNFWNLLQERVPYEVPNGMATIAIQHAVATGDASSTISMDPIRKGERSRPTLDTALIPLPVIHSDGSFSAREIAVSRGYNGQGALPLDTTSFVLGARKNAENLEQLALGVSSSYSYAGGTVYGVGNHPSRSTKALTLPTAGGWTPLTLLTELLAAVQTLKDHFYYGPYVAIYSPAWNPVFAKDWSTYYSQSVRQRLAEGLPEISEWVQSQWLTGYRIILIQLTPDVVQAVQGMAPTTVQWEEQGGFEQCFKQLMIRIPRVRADANGFTGINDCVGA
jgi:hypothetical protein